MSIESKQKPYEELSKLVDKYAENKDSFDPKELQTMREDISLCLFYLSDYVSRAVAGYDYADWNRKRNYAQLIETYRYQEDGKTKNTVAVMESSARLGNKDMENATAEARRKKELIKNVTDATQQILHSISSRLHMIQNKVR